MDETGAVRFNPFHAPAGPGGGEFASSSGASSGGKPPAKASPAAAAAPSAGHAPGHGEKARLLAEAHEDRERARALETELHALEKQEHTAAAAAKHHAAQAAAAQKAGHVVHHQHHAARHHHHKHRARTLKQRIGHLKDEIHGLREKAAALEGQAHATRAAGMVTNPGGTERLHQYWVHGEGAAKIRWGEPGDFQRCVDHLGKYIRDPQGYCNLAHHAALGIYPAQHAAMEKGRSMAAKAPYGDVPYGDPGYLDADGNQASKSGKPGVKRYPLTADKVKAAWSYINQAGNAGQYTAEQLSAIKGRIRSAMSKHGHNVSSDSGGRAAPEVTDTAERRYTPGPIELRASEDGNRIGGYGAVFGKLSRNLGGFVELVGDGAFSQARNLGWPNVICRYNHDPNMVLGTTAGQTLHLRTDRIGLDYEVEPPRARADILELVQRRDIQFSSFAFRVPPGGDEWSVTDQNYPMRTLHEVQLVDVAPVLDPAYPDATAGLRSLAAAKEIALEEIVSMAAQDELRRLFIRTDNRGSLKPPPKPQPLISGPMAMMKLMEKRRDPYADQG